MNKWILILALVISVCSFGKAQSNLHSAASKVAVYKHVDGIDLKVWIFTPPKHKVEDARPAIIFFFGGGWRTGNPKQFLKHCEYLAARGLVAMTADYRVLSRDGVKGKKCLADVKSAIRWMRSHAKELGIDPNRIMASGGSAGGHLAAATALIPGFDDPSDDVSISAEPNALALFNPALILADVKDVYNVSKERREQMPARMGADPIELSPYHHIRQNVGPTIIFHGKADSTVEFETVKLFDQAMDAQGNNCILVGYEGAGHGFFNYSRKNVRAFTSTLHRLDRFLVDLGYLDPLPIGQDY
ncbi:MAG: alpha/beta hydrolase [Saprospiraceae bacterium]|nr:alpha/beta hydrolase [Saprospiraceae bacterium]